MRRRNVFGSESRGGGLLQQASVESYLRFPAGHFRRVSERSEHTYLFPTNLGCVDIIIIISLWRFCLLHIIIIVIIIITIIILQTGTSTAIYWATSPLTFSIHVLPRWRICTFSVCSDGVIYIISFNGCNSNGYMFSPWYTCTNDIVITVISLQTKWLVWPLTLLRRWHHWTRCALPRCWYDWEFYIDASCIWFTFASWYMRHPEILMYYKWC